MAELDAEAIMSLHQRRSIRYVGLPKFPALAPGHDPGHALHALGGRGAWPLWALIRPAFSRMWPVYDLFEPEGESVRNVTFRVTYRHAERTLTDKDVDKTHAGLCEALTKSLPVRFQ